MSRVLRLPPGKVVEMVVKVITTKKIKEGRSHEAFVLLKKFRLEA